MKLRTSIEVLAVIVLLALNITQCSKVYADSLYTGGWSYHIQTDQYVDHESHNLIGYEKDTLVVAAFKNSYG